MKAWYSKVRDTELIDGSVRADYVVTFETDNFELKRKVEKYLQGIMDEAEQTEPIPYDDYIESENDHLEARCLNCNNAKACKEKYWEGCVYEPKDEKACETCKYWKYIAHEWQCETTKCQGYTPRTENCSEKPNNCKDEPQTDCAWK